MERLKVIIGNAKSDIITDSLIAYLDNIDLEELENLTRATFSRFGFSWLWIGLFPGFGVSADRTNRMLERCGSGE